MLRTRGGRPHCGLWLLCAAKTSPAPPGFCPSSSTIALDPFRQLERSADESKTILQGRHRPEQASTGRSPYHSLAPSPMARGPFTQLCSRGNIVALRNKVSASWSDTSIPGENSRIFCKLPCRMYATYLV